MTKPVTDREKTGTPAANPGEPQAVVDQRLEDLEIKQMDLENTIAELNAVIIQQYDKLEKFEQRQNRLLQRIEELSDGTGSDQQEEPPPPHY